MWVWRRVWCQVATSNHIEDMSADGEDEDEDEDEDFDEGEDEDEDDDDEEAPEAVPLVGWRAWLLLQFMFLFLACAVKNVPCLGAAGAAGAAAAGCRHA